MIRKSLFTVIAISLFSIAASAEDISGRWKGSVDTPDGSFEVYFTFAVEDGKITGTFDSGMSLESIKDGKFKEDNDKVFTFNAYVDVAQQNIDFSCTIKEDGKIRVTVVGYDMFFDISRIKEE
ncbi:MAG: hypothetical protein V2I37_07825 [Marinilabiliaceae bacterium]|jgi:hypothetical protein|nr:hypothetical protein [Marinilabiliaceae bacterium]